MNFTLFITVLLTAVTLVVAAYVIAKLIGPRSYNPVKGEPFECGIAQHVLGEQEVIVLDAQLS